MYKELTGLPAVKPATLPSNQKCEDSLLQATTLKPGDCELLDKVLGNYMHE